MAPSWIDVTPTVHTRPIDIDIVTNINRPWYTRGSYDEATLVKDTLLYLRNTYGTPQRAHAQQLCL